MATLLSGLFKYNDSRDRRVKLLSKIARQEPVTVLLDKQLHQVVIDLKEYSNIAVWIHQQKTCRTRYTDKIQTLDSVIREINLGTIVKTKEFGGESSASREVIEQQQISELNKKLPSRININNAEFNAISIIKSPTLSTGKQPKSDATVLDQQNNPVAWISLKGSQFRWGGWLAYKDNTLISQWLDKIYKLTNGELTPGMSFGLHLTGAAGSAVMNKIMYGSNFGSSPDDSNVDCVLIGNVGIDTTGNVFADTIYNNGDVPEPQHTPYIVLRYATGRNDAGFKNARAETNTLSETRRVVWLDDK